MTYQNTPVQLYIYYSNETLCRTYSSAWVGNMVAWALMRDDKKIEKIFITDTETGEILQIYKRG